MAASELKLDGNALGGLLAEIFPFEMTVASSSCDGCGAVDQVGALAVYKQAPGAVVRCPHCDGVLMRIVRDSGRYWLDLRGVACLEIRADL